MGSQLASYLIALALVFANASGSNVCICECCHPGQVCLTNLNSTFTINNCDECTTDFCFGKVFECKDFLSAKCVSKE